MIEAFWKTIFVSGSRSVLMRWLGRESMFASSIALVMAILVQMLFPWARTLINMLLTWELFGGVTLSDLFDWLAEMSGVAASIFAGIFDVEVAIDLIPKMLWIILTMEFLIWKIKIIKFILIRFIIMKGFGLIGGAVKGLIK